MKKLLCIVLAAAALLLCSCKKDAEPQETGGSIVGSWVYSNHTEFKEYLTGIIDEDAFYKVFYKFNEDGTGSSSLEGREQILNFTYIYSGTDLNLTFPDGSTDTVYCEVNGDKMIIKQNEQAISFTRE